MSWTLLAPTGAAAPEDLPANGCPTADGLTFICGPVASEDLVRVPGTAWLLASGLNIGSPAHFYLIDSRRRTARVAEVSYATPPRSVAGCSGPPDPLRLSTDGLALRAGHGGSNRLYAANHGDRQAIEVFDFDMHRDGPRLRWVDCVPLPAGNLANAVVPLPDGGLLIASFHDPEDRRAFDRMARGERTGRLLEWHPGQTARPLPGSEMGGGNGLALSRNGEEVYASAWAEGRIVVLSRTGGRRRDIVLPFLPDNLHLLPDGRLLVGGQQTTVSAIGGCSGPRCPQPWVVARVDPRSGRVETLVSGPGSDRVDYACGALEVEGMLFITVRGDNRIVLAPYRSRN